MRVSSINNRFVALNNSYPKKVSLTCNSKYKLLQDANEGDTVSFKSAAGIGGSVGSLLGGAAGLGLALLAAASGAGVIVAAMVGSAIGGINGEIMQSNNSDEEDEFSNASYSDYDDYIYEAHRV